MKCISLTYCITSYFSRLRPCVDPALAAGQVQGRHSLLLPEEAGLYLRPQSRRLHTRRVFCESFNRQMRATCPSQLLKKSASCPVVGPNCGKLGAKCLSFRVFFQRESNLLSLLFLIKKCILSVQIWKHNIF